MARDKMWPAHRECSTLPGHHFIFSCFTKKEKKNPGKEKGLNVESVDRGRKECSEMEAETVINRKT